LVVAMSAEAHAITGKAQPTEQVVKLTESAYLWVGGMGPSAAERSCAALVDAGVSALVSVGCAAGLAPACRPGALMLPAEVLSAPGDAIATDAPWRAALLAGLGAGWNPLLENIIGVDRVIGSTEKHDLHATTGAVAADMESSVVAREARRFGLPMIAIRAVSDEVGDNIPEVFLDAMDAFGRPRVRLLLNALIRRPGDAAAVTRLRSGFNKACDTLYQIAARTGPAFCCPETSDL
jgi:nucleoside phosphorylase